MINSITISGYRGFKRLDMRDLGSVNLLVGRNNSGKSSVLEALYLLASGGDPAAIWSIGTRRGERLEVQTEGRNQIDTELDLSHLFHGHDLQVGTKFSISAKNRNSVNSIQFAIHEASTTDHPELFSSADAAAAPGPRFVLALSGTPKPASPTIPLSI